MALMMNPHRGRGLARQAGLAEGEICTDPSAALALMARCPVAVETPLHTAADLARDLGVAALYLKDETGRIGLGSFKALGAAHAIAKRAAAVGGDISTALRGTTFVCASAGNHGLSVAAGAALFGAGAVVYLDRNVDESFARRLRAKGAQVVREGANYEASMRAAMEAAGDNGWALLSDSSWRGYTDPARDVMEGYLIMGAEVARQIPAPPSHIFLQAGVGGLAASATAMARRNWGAVPKICVVEPEFAPALMESIRAGGPVIADGPVSAMGRLDCKEPSHLALSYLAVEADAFMTISEAAAMNMVPQVGEHGIASTPSGVAGLAGLKAALADAEMRQALGLDGQASVLVYISEAGPGG